MHWLMTLAVTSAANAAVSQTPPQSGNVVTPPEPIPEMFMTDLDYPKDALRLRQEGANVVQVRVGTNGRVKACSVQQSSGSASLDAANCKIARGRRFKPARNAEGKAVEGDALIPMRWRLPRS